MLYAIAMGQIMIVMQYLYSPVKQLEQVDTFLYFGSLVTEDGECMTEFHIRLTGGVLSASNTASVVWSFSG